MCVAFAISNALNAKITKDKLPMVNPVDPVALYQQNVSPRGKERNGMLNGIGISELVGETRRKLSNSVLDLKGVDNGKDLREALQLGDTAIYYDGINHEVALVEWNNGLIRVVNSLKKQDYWVKEKQIITSDTARYIGTYIVTDRKAETSQTEKIEITWGDLRKKEGIQILGSTKI